MTRKIVVYAVLVLFVFGLLFAEMAWLLGYAEGSTSDKISLILALTGVYG